MTGTDPALDILVAAGESKSRGEWLFHIVNRTAKAVLYDRATAWDMRGRPALLAVSGNSVPDPRSPFASAWGNLLRSLQRNEPGILSPKDFPDEAEYRRMADTTGGLAAVLCPVPGQRVAVLFERWGNSSFAPGEAETLSRLAKGYGMVRSPKRVPARSRRRILWPAVLAAACLALVFIRVPLRIAADCEVAPRDPRLVSAPMDGVIEEILVAPGAAVKKGDRLAVYDARLMEEELKISNRQVSVAEAELAAARARGFSDARYRGEVALLEARLEQELARRDALRVRHARRVITAPADGMVQLDDARAWRGRPVSTGQAVLWIVTPSDSRVKLWLPQNDRIDFDPSRPVAVHLHALGGEGRAARLTYVSAFAQPDSAGGYSFPAEADWADNSLEPPPLGLWGTASIYGEEASLGYWLFRRPLAWARRWLGV